MISRDSGTSSIEVAEGWRCRRLIPPSRLFGANGLRTARDGRVFVAQVIGSQISALNVDTGELETISPKGGEIIAPDDVAFDLRGNLYATELMDGRVSVRRPNGRAQVLRDDVTSANGITVHEGRLFVNECRVGGRLLEIDLNGGMPRVILEDLPMPNAMEVGPDGLLYYPVMGTNEIWRVDPNGGTPQRVVGELGVPDAVKFDDEGFIVSTQVQTGEVLRIDPRSGRRTVLATVAPGLDNLTFVGDRLFVSSFTGQITEILHDGGTRATLPAGLNWPLDLTVDTDGNLYVADGTYFYVVHPGGNLETLGMLFSTGYPGFVRGLTSVGGGDFIVTTSNGEVASYRPRNCESNVIASGFDQLFGVAVAPDGAVVATELGTGRVLGLKSGRVETLASGLDQPVGLAFDPDGVCLVSASGAGKIVAVGDSGTDTVVDGLDKPQGILVHDGELYIVDAGSRALVSVDLERKTRRTIARNLPVGAPLGVTPKPLRGMPPFSGPQGPFAGIAARPDGSLFVSADAEGSVLVLRRER
jgi:sugar lactone lactonase YvrE